MFTTPFRHLSPFDHLHLPPEPPTSPYEGLGEDSLLPWPDAFDAWIATKQLACSSTRRLKICIDTPRHVLLELVELEELLLVEVLLKVVEVLVKVLQLSILGCFDSPKPLPTFGPQESTHLASPASSTFHPGLQSPPWSGPHDVHARHTTRRGTFNTFGKDRCPLTGQRQDSQSTPLPPRNTNSSNSLASTRFELRCITILTTSAVNMPKARGGG